LIVVHTHSAAAAGGIFGPPQTVSREGGGLNTAIGYRSCEDTFKNHADHTLRQNQIYSQAAYGALNRWEIYGRIGLSDLKINDAFGSTGALTATAKNDFEDNGKFFGTLGAKAFYPINSIIGVGVFIQGTYYFSKFSDGVSGRYSAAPFNAELEIKNLWDVNFGAGLQATMPFGVKLYAGPYVYYAEAEARCLSEIPGLRFGAAKVRLQNKSTAGGFLGADIPLAKGFRLNIEGQYAEHFSIGTAVTYTY